MTKTIIIPACDDSNRGDQALVWQTKEIAKQSGLADECFMLTDDLEGSEQSRQEGIGLLIPILRHPGTKVAAGSEISYGKGTYLKWGVVLLLDSLRALILLSGLGRKLLWFVLSPQERRTVRHIESADACFVKGGGFIHSTKSITDPFRAFYFLYHIMLAQALRKPVYIMPNSFGPFDGRIYRALVRCVLKKCTLITARESISQRALETIGVSSMVYPDLAFGLQPLGETPKYLDSIKAASNGRKIVGITARPYRFPGAVNPEAAYSQYIQEMAKFASAIYSRGFFPVFIEHVVSRGAHESDILAINDISAMLKSHEYAIFSDRELSAREMRSLYSECDYVIGTRFHSVIFSLAAGVRSIAIGYGGNKSLGIMTDLGLPDYVVAIADWRAEIGVELFDKLVNDDAYDLRLTEMGERNRVQYEELMKVIRGG